MYRNVKAEMARRDMSIADLAEKLNCTSANLCKKLNGNVVLTFNEAKQIKNALGVDIPLEELFEEYKEAV